MLRINVKASAKMLLCIVCYLTVWLLHLVLHADDGTNRASAGVGAAVFGHMHRTALFMLERRREIFASAGLVTVAV